MSAYTLFLILIIIVALLLILIVMVQNPKGGGLSSSFGGQGGGQNMGGVQNTTNFLDRSTWTLAITLFALILLSNYAIPRKNVVSKDSEVSNTVNDRRTTDEVPNINDVQSDSVN